jgi:hypothetical protein
MIGLAVLLIVGGALASVWLALQAGNRASFVRVDHGIAQGARITADDLSRVSLPEDYSGGIPWGDADSVVGQSATVRLLPGTVLSRAMVSKKAGVDPNKTQLTIPVDSSPFIRGLQPGAQLALAVGNNSGGQRRTIFAELVSVGRPDDEGGLTGGTSSDVPIVVTIDVSCLSVVSQGIEDKAITPALIGSADESAVARTCGWPVR